MWQFIFTLGAFGFNFRLYLFQPVVLSDSTRTLGPPACFSLKLLFHFDIN